MTPNDNSKYSTEMRLILTCSDKNFSFLVDTKVLDEGTA